LECHFLEDGPENEPDFTGLVHVSDGISFLQKFNEREAAGLRVPESAIILLAIQSIAEEVQIHLDTDHALWKSEKLFGVCAGIIGVSFTRSIELFAGNPATLFWSIDEAGIHN